MLGIIYSALQRSALLGCMEGVGEEAEDEEALVMSSSICTEQGQIISYPEGQTLDRTKTTSCSTYRNPLIMQQNDVLRPEAAAVLAELKPS